MILRPLSTQDDSWPDLKRKWRAQCDAYAEDFDAYAVGAFSVLDPLAENRHPRAEIFGLPKGDDFDAFCQVNRAKIPDYDGPVLRVRMTTLAPKYDFGIFEVKDYAKILMGIFAGVLQLSMDRLQARYLKFHLRSPADSNFYSALEAAFQEHPAFELVEVRGMWLYVTKSK